MADEMTLDPEPATPATPAEPEPAAPAEPDPDEAIAVDLPEKGGKHVPIAALKAVRDENKTLKEQASKAQQYEQWINQNKPYVDFIQQNPQLLQQQPRQAPAPADADPDLVELARSLDYVTPQGQPDIERARKHQGIIRKQAMQMAQEIVGPLAMNTYNDQANRNWQAAVQEKLPTGQNIDPNLLATGWRELQRQNPAMLADPRVVRILINNVVAEQMRANPLGYKQPAAPGRPPVVTENVGAAPRTSNRMNDTQRAIVSGRKIDDKKWGELTAGFNPGRMNVLEDD